MKVFRFYSQIFSCIDPNILGTGRSLSLKLLEQLRQKANSRSITDEINGTSKMETCQSLASRTLYELTLEESIRYNDGDKV